MEAYAKNPKKVIDFFNLRRREVKAVEPNYAHKRIADLEEYFDVTVITQNIDDLHERAGSTNVLHVHGKIFENASSENRAIVEESHEDILIGDSAYDFCTLARDGSQARPNVVLFGESIMNVSSIFPALTECEIFLVVGTSLQVHPVAQFVGLTHRATVRYILDPAPPALVGFKLIPKTAVDGIDDFFNAVTKEEK